MGDIGYIVWADDNRGRSDAVRVDAHNSEHAAKLWYAAWRKQRGDTTAPCTVIAEHLGNGSRCRWNLRVVDPVVAERAEVTRG